MTDFEHEEVVVDYTVSNETTHRCDGLLGGIKFSGSTCFVTTLSNSENLLVESEVESNPNDESKPHKSIWSRKETALTQFGDGNRFDQHEQQ